MRIERGLKVVIFLLEKMKYFKGLLNFSCYRGIPLCMFKNTMISVIFIINKNKNRASARLS